MNLKSKNIRILTECIKAFTIGALLGFAIKYVRNLDSFAPVLIIGILFLSAHARNNSYFTNNNKLEN
jgi:hypothetical protein